MKRFQFSLSRVLEFRRIESERERAKLDAIVARRTALLQAEAALAEEEIGLRHYIPADAAERQARADYLVFVQKRQKQLIAERTAVESHATAQRLVVLQAEQRCDLLEKLKARRHSEWQQEADKALEELADDSFRARLFASGRTGTQKS